MEDVNNDAFVENDATAAENSDVNGSKETSTISASNIRDSKGVSLENRMAEINRKLSKIADLDSKIDQFWNQMLNTNSPAAYTARPTKQSADPIDERIEARFAQKEKQRLALKHDNDYKDLCEEFPELSDKSSELYKTANQYYLNGLDNQEDGVRAAVEIAAYKTGQLSKLANKTVISDEAKRSRKLSEGTVEPRKVSGKEAAIAVDEEANRAFAKFGIKPESYKKALKNLGNK